MSEQLLPVDVDADQVAARCREYATSGKVADDTAFDSWIGLGRELGLMWAHYNGHKPSYGRWLSSHDHFGVHRTWTMKVRLAATEWDLMNTQGSLDAPRNINDLAKRAQDRANGIDPDRHGDDWYTPRWLFDQIGVTFDVDVCAPDDPTMRTCPAHTYYTQTDDGLMQPWRGLVWCNPPYSEPAPWVDRWLLHGNGLLLTHIPANAGWAVDVWRTSEAAVWLQALHFERPNGDTYRPGYSLMLSAIGDAVPLLDRVDAPKSGAVWRRG